MEKKVKFRLEIVAEYDDMPDRSEIADVLNAITGYGAVISAKLSVPSTVIDVKHWD